MFTNLVIYTWYTISATFSIHELEFSDVCFVFVFVMGFPNPGLPTNTTICVMSTIMIMFHGNNIYLHYFQTMVYDKSLRLSSYAISGGSMTVGQITNHMSTDALNMFFFSQRLHYLWAVPFRVCIHLCFKLLFDNFDWPLSLLRET